jgi:tetratricopeptide (TPR) repeat protein
MRLGSLTLILSLQPLLWGCSEQGAGSGSQQDSVRGAALILQADRLDDRANLTQKARLYEEAGHLLPPHDPRAASALRNAGLGQHGLGNSARALELLEAAALLATGRGNPTEAADAYVTALFIALDAKATVDARRFLDRALEQTKSPAMSATDRQRILHRISQPSAESPAIQRGELLLGDTPASITSGQ